MDEEKVRTPAILMERWLQEEVLADAARHGLSWAAYVRDTLARRVQEAKRNG